MYLTTLLSLMAVQVQGLKPSAYLKPRPANPACAGILTGDPWDSHEQALGGLGSGGYKGVAALYHYGSCITRK